ncbi:MAG: hypothetical protein RL748_2398, partial [Pseudomonadota bacterium]
MFELSLVSPDELPLLQAMAVFDAPMAAGMLAELLQLIHLKTSDGGAYSPLRIKQWLGTLHAKKLLQPDPHHGYHLAPGVRMAAMHYARQQGALAAWVRCTREFLTKRQEYRIWSTAGAAFCAREMVFSALLGQYDDVMTWRTRFYGSISRGVLEPAQGFFQCDDGVALFASIDPEISGVLLADLFFGARWRFDDCRRAYEFARTHAEGMYAGNRTLLDQVAWQALLRGDFDHLPRFLQNAEVQAEFECLMAILSGDYELSCELIERDLKAQRAQSGKRKIFVPGVAGMLYTAALLGANQVASLKRAKEQIEEGAKNGPYVAYDLLLPLLPHLLQGVALKPPQSQYAPKHNVDVLFCAIALAWQDLPLEAMMEQDLIRQRGQMQALGYMWLAAEIDVVLHQQCHTELTLPDWHASCQLKPLLHALQQETGWERALTALAQLKSQASSATITGNDVRIAWLLELGRYGNRLSPLEQKRSAKGQWSKGRAVALK